MLAVPVLAGSPLELELRSLSSGHKAKLADVKSDLHILLFFQPNCRWCERQAKVLAKLQASCSSLKVDAIGMFASYQGLRRSISKSRLVLPAYQSSPELLQVLPKVAATPVMFLLNKKGQLLQPFYGFITLKKLEKNLFRQPISQHC